MSTRLGVRRPGFQAVSATDLALSATLSYALHVSFTTGALSKAHRDRFPISALQESHSSSSLPSSQALEPGATPVSSMFFCTLLP